MDHINQTTIVINMSRKLETLSFEFFPPRSEQGLKNLHHARETLETLKPDFFSVTFGAGGSSQSQTIETILEIKSRSQSDAVPHLSCIGSSRSKIRQILKTYVDNDIRHLVALRGDLPSGLGDPGEFKHANELVEFIRETTGDHFYIEVACYPEFHPQAATPSADILNFKNKVDAGANSAITQYFYNPEAYFHFLDSCEKLNINIPIIPGIMPITNVHGIIKFSDRCGADIPRWIRYRLEEYADDQESLLAFGADVVTRLCANLIDNGVNNLHFYSLNKAAPTMQICQNLGISRYRL